MAISSFLKLFSQTPLYPLLKNAKTTSHFLQIHAQSITNPKYSDSSTPSCLLFALSQLPNPSPTPSYISLIFSQIQNPKCFLYNTIIRLHSKASSPHLSLKFFVQMKRDGIKADHFTYPFLLKASSFLLDEKLVTVIHAQVLRVGFDSDLHVANNLISSYCKTGDVLSAREVFDGVLDRDLVSWNSMVNGYAEIGELGEAQKLFDEMPERDSFTLAIMIDGYGKRAGDVARARELFDRAIDRDLVCWNSMIDGYSSAGDMSSARQLFEVMPERNVVSWSIMIDRYVRHGNPKEGLELFRRMLSRGTKPDRVSAVGAITACAQLGALDQGRWIHSYLRKNRILVDVVVETSLIDMYMKCGSLDLARRLFEGMRRRSIVSWNVMMIGLGTNGRGAEAVELFNRMEREAVQMDDLSFLATLTACTHGGLIDEGLNIFARMRNEFCIDPKVEHYGCVVDLLGRAGRLHEAIDLIKTMPVEPTPALWGSLLAACRTHRCVDLAELVVDRLARLGADDSGVYVLMSNIYADGGRWDGVSRMRELMSKRGMKKETGTSAIEFDGEVCEFVNGGSMHSYCSEIYDLLRNLSNEMVSVR